MELSLHFNINQKGDYEISSALYDIYRIPKLTVEELLEYFEVHPGDQ